ncbi:centrosomal protein 43 isoform X2 [Petromyzon marinus]|uniref:Centrosomal protein 43 n=1 Tax=Petromyzon marinus TaxID=7757 RepID=A0AAJ7XBP2_PETMA|nr:FGFR1 oncogene partner isoform X2 [Petromyzon marinus]
MNMNCVVDVTARLINQPLGASAVCLLGGGGSESKKVRRGRRKEGKGRTRRGGGLNVVKLAASASFERAGAADMSAEEDTELRDLLVQTLEGNGVLNKIKAELRAAVFLALEEQEAVQNKTPLVNEQLKNFLNSKDGLLIASLVTEFLQFFNLDFTLAVFTPETNTAIGLDDRGGLTQKLGIVETDSTKSAPLLLEILKRSRARGIRKGSFEGESDNADSVHSMRKLSESRSISPPTPSKIPIYKGSSKAPRVKEERAGQRKTPDASLSDDSSSDGHRSKGPAVQAVPEVKATSAAGNGLHGGPSEQQTEPVAARASGGGDKLGEEDEDGEEYGDSFFDDLSPKPDKVYGRLPGLGRSSDSPLLEEDKNKQDSSADITATSHAADSPADDKKDESKSTIKVETKNGNCKVGKRDLGKDEDYEDDFQSASHRSDHTKTEESIAEEIDDLSIEAEPSDASAKVEDVTLDNTFCSQNSDKADYMEDAELSSTREG